MSALDEFLGVISDNLDIEILTLEKLSHLEEVFQTKDITLLAPPTTNYPTFIGEAADGTKLEGTLNAEGGITFSEFKDADQNWNDGAKNIHFSEDELKQGLQDLESDTVIQQDQTPPTTENPVTTLPEEILIEADDASKIIELLQQILDKMEDADYKLETDSFIINGNSIEGIRVTDGVAYFYSGENSYLLKDCLENNPSFKTLMHVDENKDLLIPFVIGAAVGAAATAAIKSKNQSKVVDGNPAIQPKNSSGSTEKKNIDAMAKTFTAHKNRPHLSKHLAGIGINADKLNAVAAAITNEQFKEIVANNDQKSLEKIEGIGPETAQKILNESADFINTPETPKNN